MVIILAICLILAVVAAVVLAQRADSVTVIEEGRLSKTELRAALNVSRDNKLWRAILQLIREIQEEAKDGSEKSVANHGICASCVGGGEFLTRLRDRMILEREAAIKGEAVK